MAYAPEINRKRYRILCRLFAVIIHQELSFMAKPNNIAYREDSSTVVDKMREELNTKSDGTRNSQPIS